MPPFREALRDFSGDSGSESDSVTGSSISSASPTHTSGGATNERSSDGAGRSVRSNNDNDGPASPDTNASASPSGSQSPIVGKVTSPRSIRSIRSPSPSPPRHWSPESARSVKSDSQRSRSGSPQTARSPSVESHKSAGSRSGSPQGSIRSESPKSPVSQRSARSKSRSLDRKSKASVSPTSNSSAYGSPKSHRSRSPGSPRSNKSSSPKDRRSSSQASHTSKRSASPGSPRSNRSRSGSAASRRSGSGSRKSNKSRSRTPPSPRTDGSPTSRKSQSPKGDRSDNESEKSLKTTGDDGQKVSSYTEVVKRKHRDSGSGSESDKIPKKKRITDSDSDVENNEKLKENSAEPTADALFGDASDISTDDEKDKGEEEEGRKSRSRSRSRSRSHSRSHSRSRSRSRSRGRSDSGGEGPSQRAIIEDDEEKEKEDEPEPPPETRIDVEIPKITTDLGREIHFVKLPNFLSVETRPFDHETYEDEIDEEETLDEEGRARLKLKVENTIRWKDVFNDEGKLVKESNARFVRWSDGSMSLHLGSEIFDVYKQPLQGDHNHLYIRQGTGLQGQAVFRTKLTFRPHSTESFTHRKMTMSLADRSQKTSGIKVLSQVGMNPDQNRYEMIKKEEEKLRMAMRVQNKSKKASGGGRASGRASGAYGGEAYHDDGSDDEGAISLAAIKNKYKKGGAAIAAKAASNIYSSDEEGSDFEATRPKKNIKGKVLKDSDEDSNTASESASGSAGETNNAGDVVSD